ncbi:MAG: ycjS [Pedosphaera sp.]|nr:ycjS [Pedosphaera sp.]
MSTLAPQTPATHQSVFPQTPSRPRLGFLGVGWIGRQRMEAIAKTGLVEIAAIADSARDLAAQAAQQAPGATCVESLEELLAVGVDGVVIATPSALHAEQAIAALDHGAAVFCQKPLGRNATETWRVIEAARAGNLLLGVDLSYRFLNQITKLYELVRQGGLGEVYAADLMFHNAYGPDKAWFYDRQLSGGGCVIDLGIHLVDLALWMFDFPAVTQVTCRLFAQGKSLPRQTKSVEDYAVARLDLANGATVQLACSWKLPAGCDAIIAASFYGTKGGASFRNVDGSFYDFVVEHYRGTRRELLASAPEDWGGKAVTHWASRLADGARFDPAIQELAQVAATLDAIYQA